MPDRSLLNEIESHEMAIEVGLASGYAQALDIARSKEVVQQLFNEIGEATEALNLAHRIHRLAARDTDPRYENPHDASLFIYLMALRREDRGLARLLAQSVMRAPNLFWARKIAQRLLTRSESQNEEAGTDSAEKKLSSQSSPLDVGIREYAATFSPSLLQALYPVSIEADPTGNATTDREDDEERVRSASPESGTYPVGAAA